MPLKLLSTILIAVSLSRLSTALPTGHYVHVPDFPGAPYSSLLPGTQVYIPGSTSFRSAPNEYFVGEQLAPTHANPYHFVTMGVGPQIEIDSPNEHFSNNGELADLAEQYLTWLRDPNIKPVSEENMSVYTFAAHQWGETNQKHLKDIKEYFSSLPGELPAKLQSFIWSVQRLHSGDSVWWDSAFIDKALESNQFENLVRIGDLLELNAGTINVDDNFYHKAIPELHQILSSEEKINLEKLREVKNDAHLSKYDARLVQLAPTILSYFEREPHKKKNKGALETLYMAIDCSYEHAVDWVDWYQYRYEHSNVIAPGSFNSYKALLHFLTHEQE